MFTNDDLWLIVRFLGLSHELPAIADLQAKLDQLENATQYSPLVDQIKGDLKLLQDLDELLQKTLGITKADIVEFDAKLRAMSLITRSVQLVQQIARNLGVEPDLSIFHEMHDGLGSNNSPITINKVRS